MRFADTTDAWNGTSTARSIWMTICYSPAVLLTCGTFILLAATSRGYISVSDTQQRYLVARQIWHHGTIYLPKALLDNPTLYLITTHEGKAASVIELGSSLSMLPGVAIADVLTRHMPATAREKQSYLIGQFIYQILILPGMAALLVLGVFCMCLRLGMLKAHAGWTAFAALFGTFLFFYARSFGTELEVATVLLWALLVYTGGRLTTARVLASSTLFGVTFHYRPESLVPVALTLALILYARHRRRALSLRFVTALGMPVFVLGLLVLYHNYARTGNPFLSPYLLSFDAMVRAPSFGRSPAQFFLPAFFGIHKGFFWYSPPFLLTVLLLVPRWASGHVAMKWAAIPLAAFVVLATSTDWVITQGGWGPRYLASITPFAVILLSLALTPALRRRWLRFCAAGFVVLCALFQWCVCFEDHYSGTCKIAAAQRIFSERDDAAAAASLAGWRSSLLVSRLRTLGVFMGDPPVLREVWRSPELRVFDQGLRGNVWWLKMGDKFHWNAAGVLLACVGAMATVAGVVLVAAGLVVAGTHSCSAARSPPLKGSEPL